MKAIISLKPAGKAVNFRIAAAIARRVAQCSLWIGVIAAVFTLVGAAFELPALTIPAAVVALAAAYHLNESGKGGER